MRLINKTVKKKNDTHFADAFGNFCVFCKNAFEPMQSLPISLNEYFRRENVKKNAEVETNLSVTLIALR